MSNQNPQGLLTHAEGQTYRRNIEVRQLRATLTNQLIQATAQHKGCVLEYRDTDCSNVEVRKMLTHVMNNLGHVITILKRDIKALPLPEAETAKQGGEA